MIKQFQLTIKYLTKGKNRGLIVDILGGFWFNKADDQLKYNNINNKYFSELTKISKEHKFYYFKKMYSKEVNKSE